MHIATIHEYVQVSPRLARVTASIVSPDKSDSEGIFDAISQVAGAGLLPVRSSFTWVDSSDKNAVVGFVFAPQQVLPIEGDVLPDNFTRVNANFCMDKTDESTWEVREGAGSKYLARQGQVDLSGLLERVRSSPVGSAPRMHRITQSAVDVHEVVTFVNETLRSAEVDTGICVERAHTGAMVVMSCTDGALVKVEPSHVVQAFTLNQEESPRAIPRERVAATIAARPRNAQNAGTMPLTVTPAEYWKLVYSYDQAYLNKVLEQVARMASA